MHLDGLVELGVFYLLEKGNRFVEWIRARFNLLRSRLIMFTCLLSHISSLVRTATLTRSGLPLSFLWELNQINIGVKRIAILSRSSRNCPGFGEYVSGYVLVNS
jgi:hypothetical protein